MQLDVPALSFTPAPDSRPRVPEPPPVRLVAVDDVLLLARAGVEPELDELYVGILGFQKELECEFPVYRSANFRIRFDVREPPIRRGDLRPLRIEVPSRPELEQKMIARNVEYAGQPGLNPAQEVLVLLDPAGNWLEIAESREV